MTSPITTEFKVNEEQDSDQKVITPLTSSEVESSSSVSEKMDDSTGAQQKEMSKPLAINKPA